MRTTAALILLGLGIVLPLAVGALATWAVLASWAATLGSLLLLRRAAPEWQRPAMAGIITLNALVALAVTGAAAVALSGGRGAVSAAGLGFADTVVVAGVLAASFAGGVALALSPAPHARRAAWAALGAGVVSVYAVGAVGDALAWLMAVAYALLTFAWGLALFDASGAPQPAPRASAA